jgi:hypothetical protein
MGFVGILNGFVMARTYCAWLMVVLLLLVGCKSVQTVRCRVYSMRPVVLIGVNGSVNTILVPFCDTLEVVPRVPDTLKLSY